MFKIPSPDDMAAAEAWMARDITEGDSAIESLAWAFADRRSPMTSEPAFPPNAGWRDNQPECRGLSKREWFAGMALQGLCARIDEGFYKDLAEGIRAARSMSVAAFTLADAMIAQSKEGEKP